MTVTFASDCHLQGNERISYEHTQTQITFIAALELAIKAAEQRANDALTLTRRFGKTELFRLSHDFYAVPEGTFYFSQMWVGASSGLAQQFINMHIRPRLFSDEMGAAWLRHNVEEVGNFEHFLPALFAQNSRFNSYANGRQTAVAQSNQQTRVAFVE